MAKKMHHFNDINVTYKDKKWTNIILKKKWCLKEEVEEEGEEEGKVY